MGNSARLAVITFVALLAAGAYWLSRPSPETVMSSEGADNSAEMVAVTMPALSAEEAAGKVKFAMLCSQCHGPNAGGSLQGPPLIHKIYEPSHHGDVAFLLAAQNGVRAHHWNFGDMPPVQGSNDEMVTEIVTFIRAVQRANGIE
ncbi:MAG: cytochrome c [Nitratireductor sp.]